MDGSTNSHTEFTKSDRETQRNDIAFAWNQKKKWHKWIYFLKNRVIEGENKSWLPEAEEGINWETGIDIITLLYVK